MNTAIDRRTALIFGSAAAALPTAAIAAVTPPPPTLTLVFSANILVGPPLEKGMIDGKRERFIPITGGSVTGPRLTGKVLPGGGDWQAIHDDGLTEILARYALQADDGTVISITNPGVRVASPAVIKRLSAGEDVDPALYYFRTTPVFEVAAGPHDWLRRQVFVGQGIRRPTSVELEVYAVS
jgi:Protein of unknown function (DUF3237)